MITRKRILCRFIMLRGSSGFYTYAIYEHLKEWPAFDLDNTRIAFKPRKDKWVTFVLVCGSSEKNKKRSTCFVLFIFKVVLLDRFHYMAVADNRQRFMPLPDDRIPPRGQVLAYPEAVRLVDPVEPEFKGEVCFSFIYHRT